MHGVLFWQRRATRLFSWAEAKRDLALNLLAALPLKNKQYLPANPASYEGYLSSRTSSLIYLLQGCVFFLLAESFIQSMVTYDDLSNNPALLSDPKLVIRINDRYILLLKKVSQPQTIPPAPRLFISLCPCFIRGLKVALPFFFLPIGLGRPTCLRLFTG